MDPASPLTVAALPPAVRAQHEHYLQIARERAPDIDARIGAQPALAAELPVVWSASAFVARWCATEPEAFADLLASGDLERPCSREELVARLTAAAAAADEPALMRGLRRTRTRELVRIAWRDIAGRVPLAQTMAELSTLADCAIECALDWIERDVRPALGTPLDERGNVARLVVFAMGKLGAHELNFSSDVDLIFAWPAAGESRGGRRVLAAQDWFDRVGRRLIRVLSEVTADGFVYRVDMRLRPFGDSGPLTMSFPAMLAYFEAHARDWERYAMIKARAAAGDTRAGGDLLAQLSPFVYRRYLDFGALEALAEMKNLIAGEVARRELGDDIKRGPGGIREIEFIGQTFQLIRGGREPRLRQRSILAVLAALGELGYLPATAAQELTSAYVFLRLTENRLQQAQDRQTHELPGDTLERARLAAALGHAAWPDFRGALDAQRERVTAHFRRLLAGGDDAPAEADGATALAALWGGDAQAGAAAGILAAAGIPQAEAVAAELDKLRAAPHVRRLGRNGQARLARLMPRLLRAIGGVANPAQTLARVCELIDGVAQRSVYLALLADHAAALGQLVQLCSASPWVAAQIVRQPILLDELIDPRLLHDPPGPERLEVEMEAALAKVDPADLERSMDQLRQFRHVQVLRVAAADVAGHLPVAAASNHLSALAEIVVGAALARAGAELLARHGRPYCVDGGRRRPAGFAIVAYGKLGGLELGYASDLDLVFLHDSRGEAQQTDGGRPLDNTTFFTRLAQRLIHWLQTLTAAGRAYEIDTRLRPSGGAGLMVTSVDAWAAYQAQEAWTWEQQALVRARPVAGDLRVRAAFGAVRRAVLARPRDAATLRREIVEMRSRMRSELAAHDPDVFDLKQGSGGITDIEFMVQYAVLRWASTHPDLLLWTDNLRLLESIARHGLIAAADCRILHDAYFAYRAQSHRLALQEQPALAAADAFLAERAGVVAVWRRVLED